MRRILMAGAVSAIALGAATAAHAYSFTNIIDPLNPTFTQVLGVNGAGNIAGYGNATAFNGFTSTPPYTTLTRENVPGAVATQVTGIDAAGDTVGFSTDAAGTTTGFLNVGGTFSTIVAPGSVFNQLLGINQKGTLAAGYDSLTDPAGATGQMAYLYSITGMTFTNLNGLLPTNMNSQATGVNNAGTTVGFYQDTSGAFHGWQDKGGVVTNFQVGTDSTQALGVNDLGEIVGFYTDAAGTNHGFLDNSGVFTTIDDPFSVGPGGTTVNGINDLGQLVGFYSNAAGSTIGFTATVPEPAALTLFGTGLLGLAALGLRRRRHQ